MKKLFLAFIALVCCSAFTLDAAIFDNWGCCKKDKCKKEKKTATNVVKKVVLKKNINAAVINLVKENAKKTAHGNGAENQIAKKTTANQATAKI